nr:Glu/Leu/Phe/Val dehydrogenase dimerization domain-containing protein [Phyllobacterium endophyticum]
MESLVALKTLKCLLVNVLLGGSKGRRKIDSRGWSPEELERVSRERNERCLIIK